MTSTNNLECQAGKCCSTKPHEVETHGAGLVQDGVHGGDVADEDHPGRKSEAKRINRSDIDACPTAASASD